MIYVLVAILGAHEIGRRTKRVRHAWREGNLSREKFLTLLYNLLLRVGAIMVGIGGLVPAVGTLGWLVCGGVFLAGTGIPCSVPAVNRIRALWYLREAFFLFLGISFVAHALNLM